MQNETSQVPVTGLGTCLESCWCRSDRLVPASPRRPIPMPGRVRFLSNFDIFFVLIA